jgi:predicted permease
MLCRNRAFSALAIVSLAIGIGATTSVFGVVDRILFRSLPYDDSDRLISLGVSAPMLNYEFFFGAAWLDFRQSQKEFVSAASWSGVNDCDLTAGQTVRLSCAASDSLFLPTLGIQPILGSNFTAADDGPNVPKAVLLSYPLWQSRFGGSRDVVGSTIVLDGQAARIAGVLPRDFETPTLAPADLLMPQGMDDAAMRRDHTGRPLRVIARMPHGMPFTRARAIGEGWIAREMVLAGFPLAGEIKARVRTLRDFQVGDAKAISWVLFGSVVAVLLLACANLVNLLLARTVSRQREISVRIALGASRAQLIRQALSESLILALAGGAAGAGLAFLLLRLFVRIAPEGIQRLDQASIDWRVLAFALGCSLLCGVLFGLAPALGSLDTEALAGGRSVAGGGMLRPTLIAAQFALSLALLTGAGLMGRALWHFQEMPLGVETQQVVTASYSLSRGQYPDVARQLAFAEHLEERLRAVPGMLDIAVGDSHPPDVPLRSKRMHGLGIDGHAQPEPGAPGTAVWRSVTPGYFRALGIRLLRGRLFTEDDRLPGHEVTIISETMAKRLFRGVDPLGHRLDDTPIVGIVADVRNSGGTAEDDPEYYLPRVHRPVHWIYGAPGALRQGAAIVRTPLAPAAAARALRDAIAGLDPSLPLEIHTLRESTARLAVRPRFNAALFGLFAAIGLALAAFGLYGVLAFLVARRTREIGVRMALGATPSSVSRLVLGSAARWLAAGLLAGLALSLALARALRGLLLGISGGDPAAWIFAATVLFIAALAAAWLPARRAALVDPMVALRHE